MTLLEIRTRARRLLQDEPARRWSDAELNDYISDAQREFARLAEFPRITEPLAIELNRAEYDVPDTVLEVTRIRLRDLDIPIKTTSEMDRWNARNNYPYHSWRAMSGTPTTAVMDSRSSRSVRVFPYPTEEAHVDVMTYIAPRSETTGQNDALLFFTEDGQLLELESVETTLAIEGYMDTSHSSVALSSDASAPVIPPSYHEALVYGCLERAYLKEHEFRNIQKSDLFRERFLRMMDECLRREMRSELSQYEGINRNRLRVRQ